MHHYILQDPPVTDSALRRGRRAKMAELQRQLDPTVLSEAADRTSAPSVRQVGSETNHTKLNILLCRKFSGNIYIH